MKRLLGWGLLVVGLAALTVVGGVPLVLMIRDAWRDTGWWCLLTWPLYAFAYLLNPLAMGLYVAGILAAGGVYLLGARLADVDGAS